MTEDIIGKSLGLIPHTDEENDAVETVTEIVSEPQEVTLPAKEENGITDIETTYEPINNEYIEDVSDARDTIKRSIEDASLSLNQLSLIAARTENPQAYQVIAALLKSIVDANRGLVEVSDKKRRARLPLNQGGDIPNSGNKTTNNNTIIFSGTTSEMLKAMLDAKNKGN